MIDEYAGHWIGTYSGKKFHYLSPHEDEIDIRDIAHALALTCRFGGHVKEFYSVAEHSIRVAEIVPKEFRVNALLHDAHEAYLHDVPRPIKQDMPQYKVIADKIQNKINIKFVCQFVGEKGILCDKNVKVADVIMLATEAKFLMSSTEDWASLPDPLKRFKPMDWKKAEKQFLRRFKLYYDK